MHSKFTDIGQFRNVIRNVKQAAQYLGVDDDGEVMVDRYATLPKVVFHGSCKLHGTNAGVAMDKDDNIWYQGRKQVLSIGKDNAGFAFFSDSKKAIFKELLLAIRKENNFTTETIIIYGEWCGGNIQGVKDLAIRELEKMFVIFAIKIVPDGEVENYYLHEDYIKNWFDKYNVSEDRIYCIYDFETFELEIDFDKVEEAQLKLIDLTMNVEKECPVGKAFGKSGIGEGIVWVGYYKDVRYVFKVKGEKHSASKVKTLAPIDIEKLNSITEFVEFSVTENRLNQAIEQVFTSNAVEADRKGTGDFLRWVINDIAKEEMDTMVGNNLEPKDVNKYLSEKARKWFFKYVDEHL